MAHCPVCEQFHPFTLTGQFKCDGCQTELKLATSTIVKAIVVPVLIIVPGALLLEPVIGKGGIIALGLIVGNTLPLILLKLFYKLEATGTSLQLNEPRQNGRS